ncbi:hypothetical protein DFH08DRAFT_1030560 [Mycena albidolilacea]|uniref:Ubiquitin-like protease family profile domain-containing protein n=1 Tax=Mycena albidolilacea TaxID=1033008 RepID=A0AAD6ZHV5_9AGAR|nr:hypothetical protein DFH08DRAFT_1030560 [Mycena albidolilacea]
MIRARRLPIPDSKTVHKLAAGSRQSWLDGNQSIVYSHLGSNVTHFPLWILSYWVAVVDRKRDMWVPWRKAQEWVKNNKKIIAKNPTHTALAEDTTVMLAMLPWGLAKRGLSDLEPFHLLWRFLGTHWPLGSQMNDMLELLRYKINSDSELVKNTHVAGIKLLLKILARAADSGTYWTEQVRWIRDLGDDLVQKNTALITSAHLGPVTDEPHWVSIVVDCRDEVVVRYGDSFATPIPEEMGAALGWWLGQHTPKDIRFTDLPIARQTDSFSCGMLVGNANVHFTDPHVSLDAPTHVANTQLETFNRMAEKGLEQLEVERAIATVQDKDSDDRSDHTATTPLPPTAHLDSSNSDSDSEGPFFLRRIVCGAKFTFKSPLPTPSTSPSLGVHPTAVKQYSNAMLGMFYLLLPSPYRTGDVFGSSPPHAKRDGYGSDSESEGEGEAGPAAADEYGWGLEDNAPLPPDSQMATDSDTDAAAAAEYDDVPGLSEVSDSENDQSNTESLMPNLEDVDNSDDSNSDSDDDTPPAPAVHLAPPSALPRPVTPMPTAKTNHKISVYFQPEMAEERTIRRERDAREPMERAEMPVTVPEDDKEAFTGSDLYDDCDVPLSVVTDLLRSGGPPAVTTNFNVTEDGGITRAGDAELPDAEEEEEEEEEEEQTSEPEVCGRDQRQKIAARRYLGPAWEEH